MKRLWFAALAVVVACGPHAEEETAATVGDSAAAASQVLIAGLDLSASEGNLRVFLTDAPAAYDAVWVTIAKVEIQRGAGDQASWVTLVDAPQTHDLLSLQNDVTAVMGDAALEPGVYGQLRMIVADAAVEKDGERTPLFIPSGEQTGIKIDLSLEVAADTQYVLVTDFDAERSIKRTGAGLLMQPVIHIELIGTVDSEGEVTPIYVRDDAEDDEGDAGTEGSDEAGDDARDDAGDDARDDAGDDARDAGSGDVGSSGEDRDAGGAGGADGGVDSGDDRGGPASTDGGAPDGVGGSAFGG